MTEYLYNAMGQDLGKQPSSELSDMEKAARRLASYLNILLAIDYDVDAVDRLAKARKVDEFLEAVCNSLRRRENLEKSINTIKDKATDPADKKLLERALALVRCVSKRDIDALFRFLNGREGELRKWACYIGSRALAYSRVYGILRKYSEKGERYVR